MKKIRVDRPGLLPSLANSIAERPLLCRGLIMADAPQVAIVNEVLARKYFHNGDALGKRITLGDPRKPDVKWITIIGIVANVRHRALEGRAAAGILHPACAIADAGDDPGRPQCAGSAQFDCSNPSGNPID